MASFFRYKKRLHLTLRQAQQSVSVEQLLQAIEVIVVSEQMETLKQQGERLGEEKIRQVEQEWPELITKVRAEMEKGTPLNSLLLFHLLPVDPLGRLVGVHHAPDP